MNEKETNKAEQGLNLPKSNEELFDAINKAVSEGNQEEVDRLMSADLDFEGSDQTQPDATDPATTDTDPPAQAGTGTESTGTDDPDTTSSKTSPSTEAAPDAASVQDATPKEPSVKELMEEIHRLKSSAGRVDYLQARLTQLEREAKKAPKKAAPQPAEADKPVPRKSDERISKLKEIDPDMAETLEVLRDEVRQEFESRYGKPAPQTEGPGDSDVDIEQELSRVTRIHPEAEQIFWGPHRPLWEQWKNSLTPEQRAWAESDKAEEVIVALTAFKTAVSQHAQQSNAKPTTTSPEPDAPVDPVVDETKKARERKLQGGIGAKNPTIKSQGAVDRDKLFSEMYNQIQKDNHLG